MKVGFLIYGDLNAVSGGFLYDRLLVDYLRNSGDRVEVIQLKCRSYPRSIIGNLSLALLYRIKRSDFDLLLQDELAHPSLFGLNYYIRSKVRYPIVSIVHHLRACEKRPPWQNRVYGRIEQKYLNSVSGFIFNSSTTCSAVRSLLRKEMPSVTAVPAADHLDGGITAEEISRRAENRSSPLEILFVGNIIPRKQLHVLLKALGLMRGRWQLTVIGSVSAGPSYAASLYKQVELSGLYPKIRFLGFVPRAELSSVLRRSHILAVPSSYEGYGIVYLEAMAYGLPALGSTAGGAKEVIREGYNGFLVAPEDHWAIALRIQRLIDDRKKLATMSINARNTFLAHPGWNQTFRPVHEFLHGLNLKYRNPPVTDYGS